MPGEQPACRFGVGPAVPPGRQVRQRLPKLTQVRQHEVVGRDVPAVVGIDGVHLRQPAHDRRPLLRPGVFAPDVGTAGDERVQGEDVVLAQRPQQRP